MATLSRWLTEQRRWCVEIGFLSLGPNLSHELGKQHDPLFT